MEIGPPVLEKKIFEVCFTIYGHGGHHGHVTSILITNFFSFLQNLVQNGTIVSEKIGSNFCMYTTLGQGQEMTLAFNTHLPS